MSSLSLRARQITFGPHHHIFGYIGHVGTIPWSGDGRRVLALRLPFQDHMPGPGDTAAVVLISPEDGRIEEVDRSLGWNPQQGAMLYWDPREPSRRFFFNDRDRQTQKVFTALHDVVEGRRVGEWLNEDAPVANSGVARSGRAFCAINYARLARLRPVTGYGGAWDWTVGVGAPADDGVWVNDTQTGARRLIAPLAGLAEQLRRTHPQAAAQDLFINHTLWSPDDALIWFYVRADFDTPRRLNVPCTMRPDGSGLRQHPLLGGHPEWLDARHLLMAQGRIYDVEAGQVVGTVPGYPAGDPDVALSPDGTLLAVGGTAPGTSIQNEYRVIRRADGQAAVSGRFARGPWKGDLRVDGAPCWNRSSNALLIGAIAEDGTRQLFILDLLPS